MYDIAYVRATLMDEDISPHKEAGAGVAAVPPSLLEVQRPPASS